MNSSTSVNECVDAVFVLSVRSFADRIAHIEREMQRQGIAFEWVFEHDVDTLDPALVAATFATSDMKPSHQSLVLKHIATWRACVARGFRRILVFEDDAVLANDFARAFAAAMAEADRIVDPYMVYLGCGDNKYASGAEDASTRLVASALPLPATDATVLDLSGAKLRLEYLARHRITRPADWLMREADAEMGVRHLWLRQPIVEQGSMNGMFSSVLDVKRRGKGRLYSWIDYRWKKWWRRPTL